MIKLLLGAHQRLIRTALARCLAQDPDIVVCAEADSWDELLSQARSQAPQVVLADGNMAGIGSAEATRRLLRVNDAMRVVVMAQKGDPSLVNNVINAGAAGFLSKDSAIDELLKAVRTVARGERYISHDVATRLALANGRGVSASPFADLSNREMQVMLLITQGRDTQDIAENLCLSPKTVSTYRYRLFEKLNVKNDVSLAQMALRHGLVEL